MSTANTNSPLTAKAGWVRCLEITSISGRILHMYCQQQTEMPACLWAELK